MSKIFLSGVLSRAVILAAVSSSLLLFSCTRNEDLYGELRIGFAGGVEGLTRSTMEIPDTNDFILEITGNDGKVIYKGLYGDSPESLKVPAGSCNIKIRSEEFSSPAFSRPQFGDDRCVVVPAGGILNVSLECHQTNSGIKLKISPDFLKVYPDGVLFLKSAEGKLMYSYSEKRIAYFLPGKVSLILSRGGNDNILINRTLGEQEILTVNIQVAESSVRENGITVSVDTMRIWNTESYEIGGEDSKGKTEDNALSIVQAKASVGEKDVWVSGYIVGGDLTSSESGISFTPPFLSETNLAIAPRSSTNSKQSCMSVQLPSGEIRESLNLVEHPELIGRRICIHGDIVESYFGIAGIKNMSEFTLK